MGEEGVLFVARSSRNDHARCLYEGASSNVSPTNVSGEPLDPYKLVTLEEAAVMIGPDTTDHASAFSALAGSCPYGS